jgi:Uma2 family endonuclease
VDTMLTAPDVDQELPPIPKGFELIDGRLVEKKMGMTSGWVGLRLSFFLEAHREATQSGWVFNSETTYRCFRTKRTARKPDVSFIRRGRLKGEKLLDGECHIPPDLAVEVVSPNDEVYELNGKVEEYLAFGVRLVWVIDPKNRIALIYRQDGTIARVRENQDLDGEDVVPGFRCPLSSCLPPPEHETNGHTEESAS